MIIPTRDRVDVLRGTLAALADQRLGDTQAEVVVVDNGSRDGTLAAVEALATRFPMPLAALLERSPGAGPARNTGLAAARGEVVLFLGDDTRPADRDLLAAHVAAHATRDGGGGRAVLGRVAWAPELEVTPFMRWLEHGAQFAYADMRAGPVGPEHFYTAHVSVPRAALEAAGGFDPAVPFLFEDSLLGTRLVDAGTRLHYHPHLLVHHHHPITLAGWVRRQEAAGRAGRELLSTHHLDERIVPRPDGWRWGAATALARLAGAPTGEWRRLPRRVRERLYAAAHYAAYARGYRAGRPIP